MHIEINTSNFTYSDSLESHVYESIDRTFGRYADHVTRVEIHLADLNGDMKSGPDDKRCLIEARPAGLNPLVVEDRNSDFYEAVANATDKMRTVLEKRLAHERRPV